MYTSLSDAPSEPRSMHVVALVSGRSSRATISKSPSNSWTSGICAKSFWQSDCSDVLLRLRRREKAKNKRWRQKGQ